MSAAPPPNWYPDPHDQAQLRWWDGSKWTEHLHALVPETTVTADDSRAVPASAARETAATVEQRTAAVRESAVDQRAAAMGPEQDVLQPFQAQVLASQSAAPLEDFAPRSAPAGQPWQPEERRWSSPEPEVLTEPGPDEPPPSKRRPLIVGAVAIAVLVAVIVFAVTRDGDGDGGVVVQQSTSLGAATTVSPSTTGSATTSRPAGTSAATTTASGALAGSTFSDPTNVYRLRVAPAWQDATVVGGLQTWSTGSSSNVFRDSVNVLIEKLPGDISMDDYLAASVRNAPKSLPSFVEIGRSVNTVDGKLLGQLDFHSNQNIPLRHRAVVLIKGRNAIVVTYTTEPVRFDAESIKVQPYLTSVEGV